MRGVSITMTSVCCRSLLEWPSKWPTPGMSLRPGIPLRTFRSSSRIRPASMFVSPSFRRIVVLMRRLPNVGSPPKPVPEMLVTEIVSASVTSLFMCVRGVMSMLTPMFS